MPIIESSWEALIPALSKIWDSKSPKKVMIVTDSSVAPLYLEDVKQKLTKTSWAISSLQIAPCEDSKSLGSLQKLLASLYEAGLDRSSLIVALGGGLVSDLAGFAAAVYMRGIAYINLPTTLLAQADSSIGGKTGINMSGIKNLIGAFHQPSLVYSNIAALKTLPEKDFISGLAEIIKCGIIRDRALLEFMHKYKDAILKRDETALIHIIRRACAIKSEIVAADEKEAGLRKILNFGHTYGHAIESLLNFELPHGHCVAMGMMHDFAHSMHHAKLDLAEVQFVMYLLHSFGLPTMSELDPIEIRILMKKDKKAVNEKVPLILIPKLGEAFVSKEFTYDPA